VAPEQITHVVITHAHSDHFMGVTLERDGERVARLPRARHLLGRPEWDGNPERAQPDSPLMVHLGTIARLGLVDLVDGVQQVAPGVTVIPAPGETPGHSIVRVRSQGETCFVLGDLFHHACEVTHRDWISPGRDRAAMRSSREKLIAEALASRATLIYTHAPFPGWGRIVAEADDYVWKSEAIGAG
jgi:glyoxylase-like metal-dependent hydrolase (beta-lactamase superfamily II)